MYPGQQEAAGGTLLYNHLNPFLIDVLLPPLYLFAKQYGGCFLNGPLE